MTQPPTEGPPPPQETPGPREKDRGVLILVLGILGLIVCVAFGIAAWIMGNNDLEKMRRGQMDPSGEGLTKAGRALGIASVVLWVLGVVIWIIVAGIGGCAIWAGEEAAALP